MSCLDNIVTTGYCETVPTSGLTLKDAPEISSINLAKITNEDDVTGKTLAENKLAMAVNLIRSDFMGILSNSNVLPNVDNTKYSTGTFKVATVIQPEDKERGVTLFRNPAIRGNLRKTTIDTIQFYPLADATGVTLRIYDDYAGGMVTTYSIDLVANEVNDFDVDYVIKGSFARVVLVGTGLTLADSYLETCAGCSGTMPNDCGFTKSSYNGKDINGKSGYGINLVYSCNCDYDELLCGLRKEYIGQLIWFKARILLMEELLMTNRLNNWTNFNKEVMAEYLAKVEGQYQTTWTTFAQSLPKTLEQYRDSCLSCRGVKWVTNI